MPEISRFYGIVVYMFYYDHQPPHFHVKYQDYEAVINIQDGSVKGEISRRALRLIYEWLDLHQEELLLNWKLLEQNKPLFKIEPLK
jgi:hypothetical protein